MSDATCATCKFWAADGRCVRYPPVVCDAVLRRCLVAGADCAAAWQCPPVAAGFWCGEWQKKAVTP